MNRSVSWALLGPASALAIALGTGLFVALGIGFPTASEVLAVLPGVLLIAAVNALNEEVVLRAAPLATLRRAVGERQAIYLAVAIFAIPHFAGVPGGVIGSVMAAVFGWWVCKAMLETRGLFWPWVIHLASDVVIFTLVIGAAT